ncbi:MAG TPA: 1-acyl-sn-glycerol-3-phosphate acyltransferase [Paludibacter sp.]|nr:1-acyl-sn-glycerol-3-phosphate acyltransferase [Paludibacter sp.]
MSEIYELPLSFNLVRRYTIFAFKRYYSQFIIVGKENIPVEGPVIFAPTHTNALMDAVAVHSVVPANLPVIFLARADLFKNKRMAKFLHFVKIMPAFRMRDGMENLGKNNKVFDQCVKVLGQNKALGIMPEGNQEVERKLRPLVKGIFRIAFAAQQKYGTGKGVKIIPVGLDFGDLIKSNKHIIINVGKPIEVSEYMNAYAENPVNATNDIRDRLRSDLENLSFNLATENYYECFEIAAEVANKSVLDELQLSDNTVNRFVARQKIAKRLVALEKAKPEETKKLDLLCAEYTNLLKTTNLRAWIFNNNSLSSGSTLLFNSLLLIITSPFFLVGFTLNCLPYLLPVFIRKKVIDPEFTGFISSLQFFMGALAFPIFYILQTILFGGLTGGTWWVVVLFFFSQYPLGKLALKWYSKAKKHMAQLRYWNLRQKKSSELSRAQTLHEQIIKMIS